MARHADLRRNNEVLYGKWLGLPSFEGILKSSGIWDSINYRQGSIYLNIKVESSSEKPVNLYQSTLRPLIYFWNDILPKSSGRNGAHFRKFGTRVLDSETTFYMKSHNINSLQQTPIV
jgi:hypothetical protein